MESTDKTDENGQIRDSRGRFTDGNPGGPGRPTGVSISKLIREKMNEVPLGQRKLYGELLVEKILDMALVEGDVQMIKEIWHYIDGKPKETMTIDVDANNLAEMTTYLRNMAGSPKPESASA